MVAAAAAAAVAAAVVAAATMEVENSMGKRFSVVPLFGIG